ncbi:MAG TPA: helix-turn-helix domain-containing protein [Marinagarivorans sp.]
MQASVATKIKYDARKLSAEEQALLRQMAVSRVISGEPVSRVTRAYGLGDKTLYKWLRIYKEEGANALAQSAKQGRRRQLSESQLAQVLDWIIGQPTKMWSRNELLKKIEVAFGVTCSATTLGRLFAACGLSAPKHEGCYQSYIAGKWQRQGRLDVQELVRRKRAERLNLTRVEVDKPDGSGTWRGWAAFGVRGGMMLLKDGDLLSALRDMNERTNNSQVVMVDMPLPADAPWCSQLAVLKNITLIKLEAPAAPSAQTATFQPRSVELEMAT